MSTPDIKADKIEEKIIRTIDENREVIIDFARDIFDNAELGYKEFRTSRKFSEFLKKLGLSIEDNLAITGVKGHLNSEKDFTVSLIGELDALRIPEHSHFNKETQGAHCCGHHAQIAGVIGAALALSVPEIREKLDGHIEFFAVPAEEYGEIEFKNRLTAEGKIKYGGGKCELIRTGAFDNVDIALVHHSTSDAFKNGKEVEISVGGGTGNGFVSKTIHYEGKASHAAGSPEKGINALNAASLGLQALGMQRETFRDEDCVRVHPILTNGGGLVNVVPATADVETLVRAKNLEAIKDADMKTDRAFKAGAIALGAGVTIKTMPGYLPSLGTDSNEALDRAAVLSSTSKNRPSGENYRITVHEKTEHSGGSTDVGDLEHILPVVQFETGGTKGGLHGTNFEVFDEELSYIVTAKIFALTAYNLLKDGAKIARKIKGGFVPKLSKEEYVAFMDSFIREETLGRSKND